MLESLSIKNIALIDNCTIEFGGGLNILSGETGAGKSIILDSLGFILGARADKTLIRHGEDSAIVRGIFDISDNEAIRSKIIDAGIELDEPELEIVREMTVAGKNTCRVNGEKISLAVLKVITRGLVDIYGQHDSNRLFNEQEHINILDDYIGEPLVALKADVAEHYQALRGIKSELSKIGSMKDVYKRLDILSYEIKEINDANLEVGEEEELHRLSNRYSNVESILEGLNGAYSILQGEDSETNVLSGLESAGKCVDKLTEYDSEIEDINNRISDAVSELSDIARTISKLADNVEYDPYDAKRVEERLDIIRTLKRKYGNSIEEILSYLEKAESEYELYSNIEGTLAQLEKNKTEESEKLYKTASKLSMERKKHAAIFEKSIEKHLTELGMKNAVFNVHFTSNVGSVEDVDNITENGLDNVNFLISANLGQEPRPLDKIISGGELSRFMLALKCIIAGTDNIQTMVFDEIDSGISGAIALVVARKLYEISKDRQVLAVTHLPQLGAMADNHYLIEKGVVGNTTKTSINLLDDKARIREVARLMGGDDSELSIAHASELIGNAEKFKSAN